MADDLQNRAFHEAHALTIKKAESRSREALIEAVTARWEVGEELDRIYGVPEPPSDAQRTPSGRIGREERAARRTGVLGLHVGAIPHEDMVQLAAIYVPHMSTDKRKGHGNGSAAVELGLYRRFARKAQKHEIPEILDSYGSWSSISRDYLKGREPGTEARKRTEKREQKKSETGYRLAVVPPEVLEEGEAAGYEPEIIRKKCSEALAHLGWRTINALIS